MTNVDPTEAIRMVCNNNQAYQRMRALVDKKVDEKKKGNTHPNTEQLRKMYADSIQECAGGDDFLPPLMTVCL